jgi:hypothetical protein
MKGRLKRVGCDGPPRSRPVVGDALEMEAHQGHPADTPDANSPHLPGQAIRGKNGQNRPPEKRRNGIDLNPKEGSQQEEDR